MKVAIIGGGILGLATGLKLLEKFPHAELKLFEKENKLASHQTGHNSGVIHAGIYYKPGSQKALNCRRGVDLLLQYCNEKNIPYKLCGKTIVATHVNELPKLDVLFERGKANGVHGIKRICQEELKELEPHANGISAIYSPHTGIIDFVTVAHAYAHDLKQRGGEIHLGEQVLHLSKGKKWHLETSKDMYAADLVINCSGLHADRLAHLTDQSISPKQIIPFRGEYYSLKSDKSSLVRGLIYPVPDDRFPFLGVHLSQTIHGVVEAGPNAVLALSREGYKKSDINLKDCAAFLSYPGFWALARKYWKVGCFELYRSLSKRAFLKSLQKLVPCLKEDDLVPREAGVRSQVVHKNGLLQDDFQIEQREGIIHVINAPSPAATSSLAIAEKIVSFL